MVMGDFNSEKANPPEADEYRMMNVESTRGGQVSQ